MTILADSQIRALAAAKNMITPFNPSQIREIEGRKIISKGTGSYGYDVTLCRDIKIFSNFNAGIIDPKRLNEDTLHDAVIRTNEEGDEYFILPPNSYALGKTEEYFHIPKDVLVIALGKSTYARSGLIVNTTPIEPEFEGNVVIEISNSTSLPIMVYVNEGISQFIFFRGDLECDVSYADRGGKYQGQTGITLPRV